MSIKSQPMQSIVINKRIEPIYLISVPLYNLYHARLFLSICTSITQKKKQQPLYTIVNKIYTTIHRKAIN